MLYKLFKILFHLTIKGYFRSIFIQGKELLPNKKTPVIFVANHPSSFMDPILLAVQVNRPLYFLVRGDIFKNKIIRGVFNAFQMIPIYTADLSKGQMNKNEEVFFKCHNHLGNNKTILIFPEGSSKTERRLRPIKTGAARIAFGAEKKYHFALGLVIVPIGLNYSDPHYFKNDVFVNIGKPIVVKNYAEVFKNDNREAVLQLTEKIKSELENLTVVIENEQLEKIIEQIELLYRSKLREEENINEKGGQDFYLSQDIVKAVEYFAKNEPQVLANFKKKITNYLEQLNELHIRDTQVRSSSVSLNFLGQLLYFVLGFPFFAFGFISNYIPFKLTGIITDNVKIREDFVGAVKIAVALFVFTIMYAAESIVFARLTNIWWGILFFASLYPTGFFTIEYIKKYYKLVVNVKYLRLFMRKSDVISKLKTQRSELIDELEKRKEEFLEQQNITRLEV